MTFNETAVIVVGVFGGYWIIDALLNRASSRQKDNSPQSPAAGNESAISPTQPPNDYEAYIATHWYRILGVADDVTPEQLDMARQQLLAECHPDKAAHLGSEFRDLAEFKTKQINDAYKHGLNRKQ